MNFFPCEIPNSAISSFQFWFPSREKKKKKKNVVLGDVFFGLSLSPRRSMRLSLSSNPSSGPVFSLSVETKQGLFLLFV